MTGSITTDGWRATLVASSTWILSNVITMTSSLLQDLRSRQTRSIVLQPSVPYPVQVNFWQISLASSGHFRTQNFEFSLPCLTFSCSRADENSPGQSLKVSHGQSLLFYHTQDLLASSRRNVTSSCSRNMLNLLAIRSNKMDAESGAWLLACQFR